MKTFVNACIVRRSFLVLIIVSFIASSIVPASAQSSSAQPKSALSISPAILEEALTPGINETATIRITNTSNIDLPIDVSARRLVPNEELDEAYRANYDASSWFTVDSPHFLLHPGEDRQVLITIQAPVDAEPGGHYATLLFQPVLPRQTTDESSSLQTASLDAVQFLIVRGDIKEKLSNASKMKATWHRGRGIFNIHFQVDTKFKLHNGGNVHLLPTGEVRIYNWRNKQLAKLPLATSVILPGTKKDFMASWKHRWLFGPYRAEADVDYGAGVSKKVLVVKPVYFWIIPLPFVGLPLALVLVLSMLALWFKRRPPWPKRLRIQRIREERAKIEEKLANTKHRVNRK